MNFERDAGSSSRLPGRRGRPPTSVEDDTPLDEPFGGVPARVAWTLRTTRLMFDGGKYAKSVDFAERLRSLGVSADPSRISRWESSTSARVPLAATYELALGIRAGRLHALLRGMERALSPQTVASRRPVRSADPVRRAARTDAALQQVFTVEGESLDWWDFAALIEGNPDVYLPMDVWRALAARLVDQMSRSVGPAYIGRFEALRMLLKHPRSSAPFFEAAMDYLSDPDCQVAVDVVSLLDQVDSPDAVTALVGLMASDSEKIHKGAAATAAYKIARGEMEPTGLRTLVVALVESASTHPSEPLVDELAWILTLMPARIQGEVLRRFLEQGIDLRESLRQLPGSQPRLGAGRAIARRLSGDVLDQLAVVDPEPMLERLVLEALSHQFRERRHQACLLLRGSPYSPALSAACVREVNGGRAGALDYEVARLLGYQPSSEQADDLYRWASDAGEKVSVRALHALGHTPHQPRQAALLALARGSRPDAAAAALYALGMAGCRVALEELSTDESCTEAIRRGAGWWLRQGGSALFDPE